MVFVLLCQDDSSDRMLNHFSEESVNAFRGAAFVEKAKKRAELLEKWISTFPIYKEEFSILPSLDKDKFYYGYWEDEEVGYNFSCGIMFNSDGNIILDVYNVPEETAQAMADLDDKYICVCC